MVSETPNLDTLLPDRYPQGDLFICDIADARIVVRVLRVGNRREVNR